MRGVGRSAVVSVPDGATVSGDPGLELRAARIARLVAAAVCVAALAIAAWELTAPSTHAPASSRPLTRHQATHLPASLVPSASIRIGGAQRDFWPVRRGASLRGEGGGIASSFSAAGVRLHTAAGTLTLAVPSLGRGGQLEQASAAAPSSSANEVVYRRGSLTELYRNGPYGLEQAFTLARRPGAGAGPLLLALPVGGSLRAGRAGAEIAFRGAPGGAPELRYGQLSTLDATGRQLPSQMRIHDGTLQLLIDDKRARYPLRIDPFFQQGAKLTGGEESGNGEFGASVALSADGNTALIGGPTDNANVGAAWVFTRSGSTWAQQGPKLTASGESGKGRFGFRVALSANGSTALIGGPVDNAEAGAAWVFTLSGTIWAQQGAKLTGGEESGKGEFGAGVALSADGNTAAIGGGGDNAGAGAAWAFTRTGSTWAQQGPKLTGAEEIGAGHLGFRVALSEDGSTALIGGGGDNGSAGAAWVFTRTESTWSQQGPKLTGGEEVGPGHVGYSVALSADGNTALVGGLGDNNEIGAVWAFTRSVSTWAQQGPKLTGGGEVGKGLFGYSVALSADGKSGLVGGGGDSTKVGAAWPFTRSGSTWEPEGSKFTGGGEVGSGLFGYSVALSSDGSTALVGGPADNSAAGAAWVFVNVLQAPSAVTGAASGITQASATLNATVNPNGGTVSDCHFNYGTSALYGSSVPCTALPGSGTSPVAVSAPLSGLATNTTYHFQIVATNPTGTSEGADHTFTTANPPEFGRCVKVPTGVKGRYSTAACTVAATELKFAYEWEPGPGAKSGFTTKIKETTVATFETITKKLIVCKGQTGTGQYTGPNTVGSVVFTFTGCEMAGAKCTGTGLEEGEARTTTLEGALGVEKASTEGPVKNKIAMDLFPVGGTGPLIEFSCGATLVVIRGSVLTPVVANKMNTIATLKYAALSGKQKPEKFEGQPKDVLETAFGEAAFEQSALKLTTVQTNQEKIEINSVV